MEALPSKQIDILTASSEYVRPGGILVYSTCTILKRENEEVTAAFLQKNESFSIIEEKQMTPVDNGTDGFYICKMSRNN